MGDKSEVSGCTIVLAVTAMTFFWMTVYFITCLIFPRKRALWRCLLVAFIHVVVATVLSYLYQIRIDPWPIRNYPREGNTDGQILTMVVSLGFYLFEFGLYLNHGAKTKTLWIHHVIAISSSIDPLYFGLTGAESCAVIFGTHITTPPLILHWFMRDSGSWHPVYVLSMEYLFLVMYAFIRLYIGSFFLHDVLVHPSTRLSTQVACFCMYTIGLVFWKDTALSSVRHTRQVLKTELNK